MSAPADGAMVEELRARIDRLEQAVAHLASVAAPLYPSTDQHAEVLDILRPPAALGAKP